MLSKLPCRAVLARALSTAPASAPKTPAEIHASFMKRLGKARAQALLGGGEDRIQKQVWRRGCARCTVVGAAV